MLCRGGQGRGTTLEAAHGLTRHWDEPILDPRDVEAGCGSCHTHLPVPSEEASRRGEALFRRYDCLACHRMEGAGRGTAADLTTSGMTGLDRGWYAAHDARTEASGTDAARWRASWGAVPDDERTLVEGYLATRMGAPRLLEAKALAHRLGCRGCHQDQRRRR
ncbi:MAG: c-type cytochrome [Acidobacteriota bacterium]